MVLTLDDQIDACRETIRLLRVVGRLWSRRGYPVSRAVELCMGQEGILANLEFQKKHEIAFRRLARDLIEAAHEEAAQALLDAFPGAQIAGVRNLEEA
jgi:hypothetical protein